MAPKRPLRIPLHTNDSSRFLNPASHSSSSPLLSLAARLTNPSSRRPLLLLALASFLTYYFIIPSIIPSSIAFASSRQRAASRLSSSSSSPAHAPESTLPKLGRDFSLTPYLDARWPAGPAGLEHLAHATPFELAQSGLSPADVPPHLWLTVYTSRTSFLATAVDRLNDIRRRGSPPGETLTGRGKIKADPLVKGAAGGRVLDLEGLGLGVSGKRKGDEAIVRETRLVVICADQSCEEECDKAGWFCFAGYAGRGTTPGDLVKLKIESLLEVSHKRDVFYVSSDTKLTEDPYSKLEPLLLTSNILLQDPPDRPDPGSGAFGSAFYWFRRGRRGPDAWNAVLARVERGELAMAEADKRGINEELGSGERVLPMTREELGAWAALPVGARRRRLKAEFGEGGRVRVLGTNGVVLEPSTRITTAAPARQREKEPTQANANAKAAEAEQPGWKDDEPETEEEADVALRLEAEEARREMEGAAGAGLLTDEEEDYLRIVEGQEEEARALGEAEEEEGED